MEKYVDSMGTDGFTLETDPKSRLASRPPSSSQPKGSGTMYIDFGTSFGPQASQKALGKQPMSRTASKSSGKRVTSAASSSTKPQYVDPDSDDEMDVLSQHDEGSDAVVLIEDGSGGKDGSSQKRLPEINPKTGLPIGLKFKKNKKSDNPLPDSSQDFPAKENNAGPSADPILFYGTAKTHNAYTSRNPSFKASTASGSRPLRDKSPNHHDTRPSDPPRNPRAESDKPSRPKPRPTYKTAQSNTMSSIDHDATPVNTIRKPSTKRVQDFPMDTISPMASFAAKRKPKRSLSPRNDDDLLIVVDDSPFPTFKKKDHKKPAVAGFPTLSPLSSQATATVLDLSSSKKTVKQVSSYPILSPLGGQVEKKKRKGKAKEDTRGRRKSLKTVYSSSEDDDTEVTVAARAKPFPMDIPGSDRIDSSSLDTPRAGPSKHLGKRSSDGLDSDNDRGRKKRKDDDTPSTTPGHYDVDHDDDDLFLDPSIDPRTLCPYCDNSLPSKPTPLLKRLLAATEKKSTRDPRPTNPLGRKAPLSVFITVCQRHRFESQLLPEAEAKGWPKEIEWTSLERRVQKMRRDLKALIDDDGEIADDEDEEDEESRGPRAKCVFWREMMRDVKAKGSKAASGVRSQFANFEKTQPGYYGEQGSVIIHQTLYNLFPLPTFNAALIRPLNPSEFIQRILVPEVGLRLVMEDKGLSGSSGVAEAVKILRESASYGVAMFPEDGGDWEGPSKKDKGDVIGVADRMVMERARKRRKELEAEEREEELQREAEKKLSQEQAKTANKTARGQSTRKGKEKQRESTVEIEIEPQQRPSDRPRPRPRPVVRPKPVDADTESTAPTTSPASSSHASSSSTNSPGGDEWELRQRPNQPSKPSQKLSSKPKSRVASAPPTPVDLELSSDTDGSSDTPVEITSSLATKSLSRNNKTRKGDKPRATSTSTMSRDAGLVVRDEEATPRPPQKTPSSSFKSKSSQYPLLAARQKAQEKQSEPTLLPDSASSGTNTAGSRPLERLGKEKKKKKRAQNTNGENYDWLLESQSQDS